MNNSPKLLLSQRFQSFEELAALVIAWDFDFHQLSKNHSDTVLEQILAGNTLFSHLYSGSFSTHTGESPKQMCTIGLPDAGCPEFRYFGHLIDRPVLLVRSAGQEFDLIARPGYGMSTFSIPQDVFEANCETYLESTIDRLVGIRHGIIPVSVDVASKLRTIILELSRFSQLPLSSSDQFEPDQNFEALLQQSIFKSIQQGELTKKDAGAATGNRIFKRALDFIKEHEHESLTVRDLAAAMNTSERTLQRAFNREFGRSPQKYLFGSRMYGTHRRLWNSNPSETNVVCIANEWGFWHMGQFAKDYRRFFGELPSQTLSRPQRAAKRS
jgi:AraC-like DNA-binding protein